MSLPKLKMVMRLEDLESQQTSLRTQTAQAQDQRVRFPDPEKARKQHFHVAQILYAKDVYKNYPAWKRWLANNVHLPLFRFFHKWLALYPPTGQRSDGTYIFAAHQGCFLSKEEAEQDAQRYPHGYVVPNIPLGRSLTSSIPEGSSIYFPNKEDTHFSVDLAPVLEEVGKLRATVQSAARLI